MKMLFKISFIILQTEISVLFGRCLISPWTKRSILNQVPYFQLKTLKTCQLHLKQISNPKLGVAIYACNLSTQEFLGT